MITQNGIAPFVAFRYERIILAVEETTSANRCGSSAPAVGHPWAMRDCAGNANLNRSGRLPLPGHWNKSQKSKET